MHTLYKDTVFSLDKKNKIIYAFQFSFFYSPFHPGLYNASFFFFLLLSILLQKFF